MQMDFREERTPIFDSDDAKEMQLIRILDALVDTSNYPPDVDSFIHFSMENAASLAKQLGYENVAQAKETLGKKRSSLEQLNGLVKLLRDSIAVKNEVFEEMTKMILEILRRTDDSILSHPLKKTFFDIVSRYKAQRVPFVAKNK